MAMLLTTGILYAAGHGPGAPDAGQASWRNIRWSSLES